MTLKTRLIKNIKNYNISGCRKQFAFTLAEVLLTLTIVGVVASMTVPSVMNSTNKQQYAIGLKKFYAEFSQFIRYYKFHHGTNDLSSTGDFVGDMSHSAVWNSFTSINKLNLIKDCGTDSGKGCFADTYNLLNLSSTHSPDNINYGKGILANGMSIAIGDSPGDCSTYCATIRVDVNGLKPPNRTGRDFFYFYIMKDGSLMPYGSTLSNNPGPTDWNQSGSYSCMPDIDSTNGNLCAGRVMEESWQMNY